ncbi:MAG: hypothetical protein UX91_C0001G0093 [Candidatus Amesbacteria bacterium GW2011_GWB1_47_19]|nr:MAG: hypothetical protein UW51_C0001G0093 [Candidatus Amesbacteria bacterium GW2011_GWA1_44_24]KKU32105.1 MAG: hypothetical protein UX46_C0001G0092 [Candidatus Amesbacteria bacterium GW2011_GWC1_46_24]KKU67789.1 MAG: hypothetical protein UX91_C0001G0093 [Candidatus Amesbacteria bacterium GW2011_GWB1_47_19]OGD06024.1 MAG: hypothetical protein A2379_02940 [Candidatus Amesbacteria bacterium RIFOXYB1_FULL_47_13]HBC72387.1 hypothetical protein [Candidatus Amesbacteria bacterium]
MSPLTEIRAANRREIETTNKRAKSHATRHRESPYEELANQVAEIIHRSDGATLVFEGYTGLTPPNIEAEKTAISIRRNLRKYGLDVNISLDVDWNNNRRTTVTITPCN